MTGGTKTTYKLQQNHIFQLLDCVLDCVKVYSLLLPYDMYVFKSKVIHKINGLTRNIQYFSGTGA